MDYGAPVGVFDDTGMSAIGVMIDKMPNVALEALNQFRVFDPAFRKVRNTKRDKSIDSIRCWITFTHFVFFYTAQISEMRFCRVLFEVA